MIPLTLCGSSDRVTERVPWTVIQVGVPVLQPLGFILRHYLVSMLWIIPWEENQHLNFHPAFYSISIINYVHLKGEVMVFGDSFCRTVWGTCLSLILLELFFFFFFPLAAKLIGPKTGCQFFKNCWFFPVYPLNTIIIFWIKFHEHWLQDTSSLMLTRMWMDRYTVMLV